MKCNVIRDLLPIYIDQVCSEDTKIVVEEHLNGCEDCRNLIEELQQEIQLPQLSEDEQKKAKKPFALLKRKKRNQIMAAMAATAAIMISFWIIVDQVDFVNEIFFPTILSYVEVTEKDTWQTIRFNYEEQVYSPYGEGYDREELEVPGYPFVRWESEIVNGANNAGEVWLRLKNAEGEVITDEICIHEGEGVIVVEMEKGGAYLVEIKAEKTGVYRMAFH